MTNFKSRNLMQSDFSLSLLWLFDMLNFEVPNLLRKKRNPWLQLIGIDLAFPRSQVLNGSYNLKFLTH